MKHAIVALLIKKSNMDPEILKHYRPVSNLSFLSKNIERIVASRILNFINENGLHEAMQSGYKPINSIETALMCVCSDILHAIDNKQAIIPMLLDLSAAF